MTPPLPSPPITAPTSFILVVTLTSPTADAKYFIPLASVTSFNALDDEPIWIEYTDHYNNELFLPLTADVAARKQDGVDWAINFVFEAERLDPQSSIEVVDYIVLHL